MRRKINLNQLTLPLGEEGIGAISYDGRAKVFWTVVMLSLLSIAAYIYAINVTAHNVAMRGALEREAAELKADLAMLEFQYISLKDGITIEKARNLGFKEVKKPLYVGRGKSQALSFNPITR